MTAIDTLMRSWIRLASNSLTKYNSINKKRHVDMIELNNELISAMRAFKEVFGDIVPLRELPQNVTNNDVIEAITTSIDRKTNLLPEIFGYKKLENDKKVVI